MSGCSSNGWSGEVHGVLFVYNLLEPIISRVVAHSFLHVVMYVAVC
jgi:hypothetical protein